MSYLRKKFALPTNFDRWFTYCVLSQQNSVSVEIALLTYLSIFGKTFIIVQKLQRNQNCTNPPPPYNTTALLTRNVEPIAILAEKSASFIRLLSGPAFSSISQYYFLQLNLSHLKQNNFIFLKKIT